MIDLSGTPEEIFEEIKVNLRTSNDELRDDSETRDRVIFMVSGMLQVCQKEYERDDCQFGLTTPVYKKLKEVLAIVKKY